MLFNSAQFLIFFPVVTVAYFALPHRYRWFWLLAASCYFYMVFVPAYILILFFTISVDYVAGILIEGSQEKTRKLFLTLSIIANVGVLVLFKYLNFLNANFSNLAALIHWNYPVRNLGIILPIGLSFHTFQSLAYTIEIYRGNQKAERHPGILALYVMFYPQLVAGPIERPQNLLPQLRQRHAFDYQRVTDGLKLMAWGFFKKVVIADRLAEIVNPIYDNPTGYQSAALVLATLAFAFQIYCDFSGYSDIAIGAAQVMGIRLMENFRRPYFSKTVAEFWTRWHISLSTWFRDYVFFPLGSKRVSSARWQLNIMVTFLISGLWHGANWTFIVWGALHGFYLLVGRATLKFRRAIAARLGLFDMPRLHRALKMLTVSLLITFAWIFFRARNLPQAVYIVRQIPSGLMQLLNIHNNPHLIMSMLSNLRISVTGLVNTLIAIAVLETVELMQRSGSVRVALNLKSVWIRWSSYYALILLILMFGKFEASQFIYFQF